MTRISKILIYFIVFFGFTLPKLNAAQFTPGNIVVVRIGDGSIALSGNAAPVFLDEFTTSGVLVQTLTLPVTVNGGNRHFVNSGSATSEGGLILSVDRHWLTLAGYDTIPGFASVASTAGINRVIAFVGYNGAINTTTNFIDGYLTNNIRSAVSLDGTQVWTSGTGSSSTGGVRYTTLGGTTTTQISTTVTNTRYINIFNGNLFASASSGAFLGVNQVGTGLPTTAGQTITNLINASTGSSSYGFSFSPDGNTCYVADDRALPNGGIQKWTFNSSAWTLATTITSGIVVGCRGLTVDFSGASPVLFAVTNNSTIVKATDNGSPVFTTIDSTSTNTVIRGIAFAPVPFAPASPSLVSPANNSVGQPSALTLVWNKSTGATNYRVQLATDAGFSSIIVNDSTLTDSVRNISGLLPLTNYWWRVSAKNAGGTSTFSSAFTFRTLGVPNQISGSFIPPNNSVNQALSITFRWSRASEQTLNPLSILNYGFEFVTDTVSLANPVRDTTLTDTVKVVNGLTNATNYWWHVRAKNQNGWGTYSVWNKLTTVVSGPPAPNLVSPPNNSAGASLTPTLIWDTISVATSYRVQVSTDSTFATTIKDTTGVINARYTVPSGLLSNLGKYFWRVQASNAGGNGPFSTIFNFTVGLVGISQNIEIPKVYKLYNNYPNPFNPETQIKFDLPIGGFTTLKIYDILGRLTATLVNGDLKAGRYELRFNATELASGIYFYKLESGNFTSVKKLSIIK